jgi:hypothetical protein
MSKDQEIKLLKEKIRLAMMAFNEILDDTEELDTRKDLIIEVCKEALGVLK